MRKAKFQRVVSFLLALTLMLGAGIVSVSAAGGEEGSFNTVTEKTIADYKEELESISYAEYQKLFGQYATPDIVIIAIGTNGGILATQAQIDTAYATDFAQLDLTDDAQAFRYCNEKIRNLYPNAKIIWCNPIQGATKSPQNIVLWGNTLHTLTAYGAVNNVETNRCGINQSEEAVSHVNLLDGVHPNFDGSMLMALYNAAAIEHMYV